MASTSVIEVLGPEILEDDEEVYGEEEEEYGEEEVYGEEEDEVSDPNLEIEEDNDDIDWSKGEIHCPQDKIKKPTPIVMPMTGFKKRRGRAKGVRAAQALTVRLENVANLDKVTIPVACEICHKVLSNGKTLLQHMQTHDGNKQYRCPYCTKDFSRFVHLQAHLVTHGVEKQFECPVCFQKFSRIDCVKIHMRMHDKSKCRNCPICQKAFLTQGSLDMHMRIHRGEKPFKCHICGKCFTQKSHVVTHIKRHQYGTAFNPYRTTSRKVGDRVFVCKFCPRSFVRMSDYQSHVQWNHGAKDAAPILKDVTEDEIPAEVRKDPLRGRRTFIRPAPKISKATPLNVEQEENISSKPTKMFKKPQIKTLNVEQEENSLSKPSKTFKKPQIKTEKKVKILCSIGTQTDDNLGHVIIPRKYQTSSTQVSAPATPSRTDSAFENYIFDEVGMDRSLSSDEEEFMEGIEEENCETYNEVGIKIEPKNPVFSTPSNEKFKNKISQRHSTPFISSRLQASKDEIFDAVVGKSNLGEKLDNLNDGLENSALDNDVNSDSDVEETIMMGRESFSAQELLNEDENVDREKRVKENVKIKNKSKKENTEKEGTGEEGNENAEKIKKDGAQREISKGKVVEEKLGEEKEANIAEKLNDKKICDKEVNSTESAEKVVETLKMPMPEDKERVVDTIEKVSEGVEQNEKASESTEGSEEESELDKIRKELEKDFAKCEDKAVTRSNKKDGKETKNSEVNENSMKGDKTVEKKRKIESPTKDIEKKKQKLVKEKCEKVDGVSGVENKRTTRASKKDENEQLNKVQEKVLIKTMVKISDKSPENVAGKTTKQSTDKVANENVDLHIELNKKSEGQNLNDLRKFRKVGHFNDLTDAEISKYIKVTTKSAKAKEILETGKLVKVNAPSKDFQEIPMKELQKTPNKKNIAQKTSTEKSKVQKNTEEKLQSTKTSPKQIKSSVPIKSPGIVNKNKKANKDMIRIKFLKSPNKRSSPKTSLQAAKPARTAKNESFVSPMERDDEFAIRRASPESSPLSPFNAHFDTSGWKCVGKPRRARGTANTGRRKPIVGLSGATHLSLIRKSMQSIQKTKSPKQPMNQASENVDTLQPVNYQQLPMKRECEQRMNENYFELEEDTTEQYQETPQDVEKSGNSKTKLLKFLLSGDVSNLEDTDYKVISDVNETYLSNKNQGKEVIYTDIKGETHDPRITELSMFEQDNEEHVVLPTYSCKICGREFRFEGKLHRHIESSHQNKEIFHPDVKPGKSFTEIPSKSFTEIPVKSFMNESEEESEEDDPGYRVIYYGEDECQNPDLDDEQHLPEKLNVQSKDFKSTKTTFTAKNEAFNKGGLRTLKSAVTAKKALVKTTPEILALRSEWDDESDEETDEEEELQKRIKIIRKDEIPRGNIPKDEIPKGKLPVGETVDTEQYVRSVNLNMRDLADRKAKIVYSKSVQETNYNSAREYVNIPATERALENKCRKLLIKLFDKSLLLDCGLYSEHVSIVLGKVLRHCGVKMIEDYGQGQYEVLKYNLWRLLEWKVTMEQMEEFYSESKSVELMMDDIMAGRVPIISQLEPKQVPEKSEEKPMEEISQNEVSGPTPPQAVEISDNQLISQVANVLCKELNFEEGVTQVVLAQDVSPEMLKGAQIVTIDPTTGQVISQVTADQLILTDGDLSKITQITSASTILTMSQDGNGITTTDGSNLNAQILSSLPPGSIVASRPEGFAEVSSANRIE